MLKPFKELARVGVNQLIVAASRTRVIGERVRDARAVADHLIHRGFAVTLSFWNQDSDTSERVVSSYEEVLDSMGVLAGQTYLSIKAPAFDYDLGLYAKLLAKARRAGIPLHFDSLGPESADRVFSMIAEHTPPPFHDIGCTLPGRWKRSLGDAERLKNLDVPIRVVKGEWPDPADSLRDPREGFSAVISRLAGRSQCVRVATHDCDLARDSIHVLHQAGTPCDLELLYGFPVRKVLHQMKDVNVPIRLYLPFGSGWIPYCWKHVRARPAFLWWLVKDSLWGSYRDGFASRPPTDCRTNLTI